MNIKKISDMLSAKLKNKQTVFIILIIGVIIMLTAGAFAPSEDKSSAGQSEYDYCRRLEENLTGILSEMKGVGKVRVMITPEETDKSENAFFSSESRSKTTGIKGVVIAADGAGDPKICEKIYYAAKAALNIGGSRIAVVESK